MGVVEELDHGHLGPDAEACAHLALTEPRAHVERPARGPVVRARPVRTHIVLEERAHLGEWDAGLPSVGMP